MRSFLFSENKLRLLLRAGIVVKMGISVLQIAAAVFLYWGGYSAMNGALAYLGGKELLENPLDPFWKLTLDTVQSITVYPESFWIFILFSHGFIKVLLSVGLWLKRYWAYPATAVVFAIFAMYQIYQMFQVPSLILALVTVFDIALIWLIIHEYRHHLRSNRT